VLPFYKRHKAIGAFNVYNDLFFDVVLRSAEFLKAPVIIQVSPKTLKYFPLDYFVSLAKTADKIFKIPFSLHLDHGDEELAIKCLEKGFCSVMIDASNLSLEENIKITKKIVKIAKRFRAAVEAELGQMTHSGEKIDKRKLTSPEEAEVFVKETNVDFLAVSVGTQHGMSKFGGKEHIFFDHLEKIFKVVKIPLVLHGASGVSREELIEARKFGIAKVNFDTSIRKIFTHILRKYLSSNLDIDDPRIYLKEALKGVENLVKGKISILKS